MPTLRYFLSIVAYGFVFLSFVSCGGDEPDEGKGSDARIIRFFADPPTVTEGEPTTLHWETRGAATVILLENGIKREAGTLPAEGSLVVTPATHSTYRLEAMDKAGRLVEARLDVEVEPFGPPRIERFTATPSVVGRGDPVTLEWRVVRAESLEIVSELGGRIAMISPAPEEGSHTVRPTDSGSYGLRARNAEGMVTAETQVKVGTRPKVGLTFSRDQVAYGEELTLSWTVSHAESIAILDPEGVLLYEGPGEGGDLPLTAEKPGEYRATAVGLGGEESAFARLDVKPRVEDFKVLAQGTTQPGSSALVSWNVKGAERIVISNGVMDVVESRSGEDSGTVKLADGGAFVLRAYSGSLVTEQVSGVQVVETPLIREVKTGPKVTAGQGYVGMSTIGWEIDGASKLMIEVDPGGVVDLTDKSPRMDEVDVIFRAAGTVTVTALNAAGSHTVVVPSPVDPVPTITSLFAAPSRVGLGEFVEIHWDTLDAQKVVLERDGVELPVPPGDVSAHHLTVDPVVGPSNFVLRAYNGLGHEVVSAPLTVDVGAPNQLHFDTADGQKLFRVDTEAFLVWENDGGTALTVTNLATGKEVCGTTDWVEIRKGGCPVSMPSEQADLPLLLEVKNGSGTDSRLLEIRAVTGPIILSFTPEVDAITEGDSLLFFWETLADAEGNIPTLSLEDDRGNVYDMSDIEGDAALLGSKRFRVFDWGAEPRTFTLKAESPVPPTYTITADLMVYGIPTVDEMQASPPFALDEGDLVHFTTKTTHGTHLELYHLAENGTVDATPFFTTEDPVDAQLCSFTDPLTMECTVPMVPTIAKPHVQVVSINPLGARTDAAYRIGVAPATISSFTANGQDAEVVDILMGDELTLAWQVERSDDQVLRESFFDISTRPTATLLVDWSGSTLTTNREPLVFPNGFVFPYDGDEYTAAQVMVGGYIAFDMAVTGTGVNQNLPYTSTTASYRGVDIAPFWDSMRYHKVWYELIEGAVDRLIIQWTDGEFSTTSGNPASLNFQVVLFEDGRFEFHYGEMTGANDYVRASTATIGAQNVICTTGCTHGQALVYNTVQPNGLEGRMYRFNDLLDFDEVGSTPVPMPSSGSMTFVPTESRTYALRAWNGHSEHEKAIEVRMHPKGEVAIWSDPAEPLPGQAVTLHWAGTNLTSLVIEDASGVVHTASPSELASGSLPLGALAQGIYRYTFHAEGMVPWNQFQEEFVVSVFDAFDLDDFSASSTRIKLGEEVTLSWETTNATSATITDSTTGVVTQIPANQLQSGFLEVSPERTTTYAIEVESHERFRHAEVTVEVRTVWIDDFQVTNALIPAGSGTTLTWDTTADGALGFDRLLMVEVDSPFEDISALPGKIQIHGPNVSGTVKRFDFPANFEFPFFEENRSAIMVSVDGWAGFDLANTSTWASNQQIPTTNASYHRISLPIFWDDLHSGTGTVDAVFLQNPDRLIIQWTGVRRNVPSTDWDLNFQIVLFPSGAFEYRYGTMKPPSTPGTTSQCNPVDCVNEAKGSSATIGFQNIGGREGFELHYGATTSSAPHAPFAGGLENRSFRFDRSLANGSGSLTVKPSWPTTYTICIEDADWKECEEVFVNVIQPGDFLISELMVSPVGGVSQEWFEVRNVSRTDFDMEGVTIRSGAQTHTIQASGLVVPMGGHLVFARSDLPSLLPDYVYGPDIDLPDTGDLSLEWKGITLAKVEWDASWTVTPGASLQLRGDRGQPGIEVRADAGDFCETTASYDGGQNRGTPGGASDCGVHGYVVDFFSDKPFIDIRWTGTRSSVLNADDAASYLNPPGLGFDFPFFAGSYNELWMSSNGVIGFGNANATSSNLNRDLTGTLTVANTGIIAALWDDLSQSDDLQSWVGFRLFTVDGQMVRIVQYDGLKRFNRPGSMTFQIQLWANGDIVIAYRDLEGDHSYFGAEATVGIEGPGGSPDFQYSYNQPLIRPNQSLYFKKQ